MKKVGYKYWLRLFLISFMSISVHHLSFAQPWPNDPWGGGAGTDPVEPGTEDDPGGGGHGDPDLPIDSNILVLVIAVVGYGLKKTWDVKQNLKRRRATANYEDFIK